MIPIKRVKRIAVAVKDLDAAIEKWKQLFGIKPFMKGAEPEDRYAFAAFYIGEGDTTVEFLAPVNDPEGEMLIGRFIKKRGEGLYMITLETEGTSDEVDRQFEETGIEPAWGGQLKHWAGAGMEETGIKSWTEHYISPKDANGVLITLASIEYADPELIEAKPGVTLKPKK